MSCEEKPKRRRIIIISGDESVIDEIKNSKNASLCKSVILETEDGPTESPYEQVRPNCYLICFNVFIRRLICYHQLRKE